MSNAVPSHLILLCCHAIYIPASHDPGPNSNLVPSTWLIAPFQTGEEVTFTKHLHTALNLLAADLQSLLVISGSKTRPEIDLSEAESYLALASERGFFDCFTPGGQDSARARIVLEERALDSFGNVVLGMIEFWRRVGTWPQKITVVSHDFKKERFLDVHRKVLEIPEQRFDFVGVDPEYMDPVSEEFDEERCASVRLGEQERGLKAWQEDEDGRGAILRGKRWGRNWWNVSQELFKDEQERKSSGVKTEFVEFEWKGNMVIEEYLVNGLKSIFEEMNE